MQAEPNRYNIMLTMQGKEVEFEYPPASPEQIYQFTYLRPHDKRCNHCVVTLYPQLVAALQPVLGTGFNGQLLTQSRKHTLISLHDTAILGYQRQDIIDPRIQNIVATAWEIFCDKRVFLSTDDQAWLMDLGQLVAMEIKIPDADAKLADDIKNVFLRQQEGMPGDLFTVKEQLNG